MERSPCETLYITFILEDGILIGLYKPDLKVDLEIAKEMVDSRIRFSYGKSVPFLADVREIHSITKEARDYMANEGVKGIDAVAVLVNNFVSRVIGNFFINFSKPKVPAKLFTNKKEAIEWLKHIVQ